MKVITKGYKELIVWQKAMQLANHIYDLTESFTGSDATLRYFYSFKSEFHRFLRIAYASGAELETQIELSRMRNYGSDAIRNQSESLLDEVMRMLNKLIKIMKG